MNCEENLSKLLRTISQESANVSINETLINLLQQNRAEKKLGGKEEEKGRYNQVRLPNDEIPEEEEQLGPSQQYNNLAESLNDESSDEKNCETTCKVCKTPWIEMTEKYRDWAQCNICDEYVCQKCYGKRYIP